MTKKLMFVLTLVLLIANLVPSANASRLDCAATGFTDPCDEIAEAICDGICAYNWSYCGIDPCHGPETPGDVCCDCLQ